jgi:hypothetical protein
MWASTRLCWAQAWRDWQLFGTLDPGPGRWTYRVWWHLVINAFAMTLLALAVARRRDRGVAAAETRWAALAR